MIRISSLRAGRLFAAVLVVSAVLPAVPLTAAPALALTASAVSVAPAPAAAPAGDGAAWSIETADNDHGSERANYAYEVAPGDVIRDTVIITNTGTTPLDLGLYAADAFTTAEGVLDLRLADDAKDDSGAWLMLGSATLALDPGRSAEVPFTITVPADARPGDHPAGIVTSLLTADAGSPLTVDRRLGIRVHLRVSGDLRPSVAVDDVVATFTPSGNPFGGGAIRVSYTLTNTGDTRITADDAVVLAGPLGAGAAAAKPQATPEVLPGSSIVVEREITGVAPLGWIGGSLTVAPSAVGIGMQPLDVVTVDVSATAMPWTLLGLLVLVAIGVLVAVLVILRRRRRRAPAAGSAGAVVD